MEFGAFSLSPQLLADFVCLARRRCLRFEAGIERQLALMGARRPIAVDPALVHRDTLLSEDPSHGRTYGTVSVRNPFLSAG